MVRLPSLSSEIRHWIADYNEQLKVPSNGICPAHAKNVLRSAERELQTALDLEHSGTLEGMTSAYANARAEAKTSHAEYISAGAAYSAASRAAGETYYAAEAAYGVAFRVEVKKLGELQ